MDTRLFSFMGGDAGVWKTLRMETLVGSPIPLMPRLDVVSGPVNEGPRGTGWLLRGITSNERYVHRGEKEDLLSKQPRLGRPEATCAALIPIRKNAAWWGLTQDERRKIFAEQSDHIRIGMRYLPAIARRLHHCRDLGEGEPFDFLTWFEYAPSDEEAFDDLLVELRTSPEWKYVDREIDLRLIRG